MSSAAAPRPETLRLGISSCLLGQKVRYDGGHKADRWLTDVLGQYVEFVPVCPEMGCGLPAPREAMRLAGDPQDPRLVTVKTGIDHTARMAEFARRTLLELERADLSGYVLKANSPSCGMERVKVHGQSGAPSRHGIGIFARALMARLPHLPVEEEGRLQDARIREDFIERIFVMQRWRGLLARNRSRGGLVEFHADHKLLLMAHGAAPLGEMGRLVAAVKDLPLPEAFRRYLELLMRALEQAATVKKNANVLMHALGYFKKDLSRDEKHELLEVIDSYRGEHVPLIVPITLINHFVRKFGCAYLARQVYLNPHPIDLKLRNHA